MRLQGAISRFDQAEEDLCRAFNAISGVAPARRLFTVVSRLGDGVLWYAIMAVLPIIYGDYGLEVSIHMGAVGLVALTLYKILKGRAVRERPFITHGSVKCVTAPLDRYSFPSGHTLHAVAFSVVVGHFLPEFWLLLGGFTFLVALSRVVLGLHYPTDVVAGAVIGLAVAKAVLLISFTGV